MSIAFQLTIPTPPASPSGGPRRSSEPTHLPLFQARPPLRRASSVSDLALGKRGPLRRSPYPSMIGATTHADSSSDSETELGDERDSAEEGDVEEGTAESECGEEELGAGAGGQPRPSGVAESWQTWLDKEKQQEGRNSVFYDSVHDSLVKHRKRVAPRDPSSRRPPPAFLQLRPAHPRPTPPESDDDLAHAMQLTSSNLHALDNWTNPLRTLMGRTQTVETALTRSAATATSSRSTGGDARSPSLGMNRSVSGSSAGTLVGSDASGGWSKFKHYGFADSGALDLDLRLGLIDQLHLATRRAASTASGGSWSDWDGVGLHCEGAVTGGGKAELVAFKEEGGWSMTEAVLFVFLAVLVKLWLSGGAA